MDKDWKGTEADVKSFYSEKENSTIHIIKTGFNNIYLVVWVDYLETQYQTPLYISKEEAERLFEIKL